MESEHKSQTPPLPSSKAAPSTVDDLMQAMTLLPGLPMQADPFASLYDPDWSEAGEIPEDQDRQAKPKT